MDLYNDYNEISSHYEISVNNEKGLLERSNHIKHKALIAMDELEGWCTKFKATVLIDLVLLTKAETIVEIGVWGGKSLIPMAFALKEVGTGVAYGIDPWDNASSVEGMGGANEEWWSSVDHEAIYKGLVSKISQFDLKKEIHLIRSTSAKAPIIENIDVLHIDGNHSEKTSFFDVKKWVPHVRKGGVIIFDDITWGTTNRAVEWLNTHCIKIGEYHESNDWAIWIKP